MRARLSKDAQRATLHSGRVFYCASVYNGRAHLWSGATGSREARRYHWAGLPTSCCQVAFLEGGGRVHSNQRNPAMSKTGNGRRASARTRDTPETSEIPFDIVLQLQCEHYHMESLLRALSCIVTELVVSPVINQHSCSACKLARVGAVPWE